MRFNANLDFAPLNDEYRLAKRFVELDKNKFSLRLGDFYYSSGRGLVLSILKTFEKEGLEYIIDKTIDGGKLSLSLGPFFSELLGGWIDREGSNLKDKVFTCALGWQHKSLANIKFHYLYSKLEKDSFFGNKKVAIESVSLDIPKISDHSKFYGEFSLIQRETYLSNERIDGHGLYLVPSVSVVVDHGFICRSGS